ncbi:MAG: NAD(P)-dependent oxidoreductase [Thermomicrobiales bacterium]
MNRPVRIVMARARYGGARDDLSIEQSVIARYPHLAVELELRDIHTPEDILAAGRDADALMLSLRDALPAPTLERLAADGVTVIGRYGTGLDNVDLDAAANAGIVITHFPAYCTTEVADHTVALVLALNRRIVELDQDVRSGVWVREGANTDAMVRGPIAAMGDLTIGIIAIGAIGRAIVERLQVFGPTIVAHDPYVPVETFQRLGVESVGFDDLLQRSDVVILMSPLLPSTRGMIGAEQFAMMKPEGMLVNTSRGAIVDEAAMIAHLEANPRFRVGLDVFEHEPLPLDSPLLRLPNVIVTPHAGFYSTRSTETILRETMAEVLDVLSGQRPAVVANPAVLEKVSLAG